MFQIDENRSGGEVDFKLGESFEVRLPENPTTGYRWRLNSPGGPVVEVQDDAFLRSEGALGAGGKRTWRFKAVAAGDADLEMAYRRGEEQSAARTFRVAIRVR